MSKYWTTQNDTMLEIVRGAVNGFLSVIKFGRTTNADLNVDTDIWDRANATDDQDIFTAPTIARVHQITSTSTSDDGDPAGVGARTIRVYGLTSWTSAETSEDITMNGTSNVATTNSYVIIHRMQVLTKGATSSNVGAITATADTDGTVTAQIVAGAGQTQMAIYGIPTGDKLHITQYYASGLKSGAGAVALVSLLVNPEPDNELTNFLTKHTNGFSTDGSTHMIHKFAPYLTVPGPAIVKLQVNASANDTDVSGGFDGVLESASVI